MAKIILSAVPAQGNSWGGFSVMLSLIGDSPFPSKTLDVRNTTEAMAAFDAYKAEIAALGKPAAVSISLAKGERSPNGFKAATAGRHFQPVNL